MKTTTSIPLTLALLAIAGFITGCGKGNDAVSPVSTSSPTGASETEIASVLAMVPELGEDGLFMSEEETELSAITPGASALQPGVGTFAPIRPLRWWRHITDVDRRFEFEFTRPDTNGNPQYAVVTIHKRLRGTFNIATFDDGDPDAALASNDSTMPPDPADIRIVRKRLADHWVRRVLLQRVQRVDTDRKVWRVAATSGVKVTSAQLTDSKKEPTKILSLQVRAGDNDTTITNPLHFVHLRNILKVAAGEKVELTVTTQAMDDIVVLMHRGNRFRFRNNGDGTHTGVWQAPDVRGIHHFGVNALSNGTLLDDEEPYCSDAWILPYVNVRIEKDVMPDA